MSVPSPCPHTPDIAHVSDCLSCAWRYTQQITVRTSVRAAPVDAMGQAANLYPLIHATANPSPPTSPWALPLADHDGFRLLAFDLDAKPDAAAATADAQLLAEALSSVGIAHLVCASGPTGGRHLWVGLSESVSPALVERMARVLRQLTPTLDLSPLTNPATGCVRPPGSPHRHGGTSRVLSGHLSVLQQPSTSAADLQRLLQAATAQLGASTSPTARACISSGVAGAKRERSAVRGVDGQEAPTAAPRRIALDATGHPYLPGPPRPLPQASHLVLRHGLVHVTSRHDAAPPAGQGLLPSVPSPRDTGMRRVSGDSSETRPGRVTDASSALWHVLIGAASSHWHLSQLLALLSEPRTPGLEHARTRRSPHFGSERIPRPRTGQDSPRAVLARQWARAVRWAAANPRAAAATDVNNFAERAGVITDLILDIQTRADALPGRWSKGPGPADRRVLDGLCVLALQGVTGDVEADIRRLGLLVGIGRETARTSLLRLADEGWIVRVAAAAGVRGAVWSLLSPRSGHATEGPAAVIHSLLASPGHKRSRAPRELLPRPSGPTERSGLLHLLEARLEAGTHDALTPGSLGLAVGNVLGRLTAVEPRAGRSSSYVEHLVRDLEPQLAERLEALKLVSGAAGLAGGTDRQAAVRGLSLAKRRRGEVLDRVATDDGTYGRLAKRHITVALERELWAWWCAEMEWMRASRSAQRARPGAGQEPLWGVRPRPGEHHHRRHPRRPTGRADFSAARNELMAA